MFRLAFDLVIAVAIVAPIMIVFAAIAVHAEPIGCPACPSYFWELVIAGGLGLFAGANIGLVTAALFAGGRDDE
jgi:hypothetical protein